MSDIRLSHHVTQKARTLGVSLTDVYLTASDPSIRYESRRHTGQWRHVRDGLVAVVDNGFVITIYKNVVETPLRPDQIAEGVVRS